MFFAILWDENQAQSKEVVLQLAFWKDWSGSAWRGVDIFLSGMSWLTLAIIAMLVFALTFGMWQLWTIVFFVCWVLSWLNSKRLGKPVEKPMGVRRLAVVLGSIAYFAFIFLIAGALIAQVIAGLVGFGIWIMIENLRAHVYRQVGLM